MDSVQVVVDEKTPTILLLVCTLMKFVPKNLKAILLLEVLRSIQIIILKSPRGHVAKLRCGSDATDPNQKQNIDPKEKNPRKSDEGTKQLEIFCLTIIFQSATCRLKHPNFCWLNPFHQSYDWYMIGGQKIHLKRDSSKKIIGKHSIGEGWGIIIFDGILSNNFS